MNCYIDRHNRVWVKLGEAYYILGDMTPNNPKPSYNQALAHIRQDTPVQYT